MRHSVLRACLYARSGYLRCTFAPRLTPLVDAPDCAEITATRRWTAGCCVQSGCSRPHVTGARASFIVRVNTYPQFISELCLCL
ncbi:unnamed protein product [Parajaminaea phylloscopi]